ncbi:hypothetical protein EVAR_52441_1 [Eumeta japonica]|uniref:Uncharacterized protein n=1 Tax=Eumeta variegata TaxID=151549 RepID=A0A4C1YKI7_EUMVA|nr:hypothetical protein EVAR_52441_1 [Eumeta japonica]
MPSCAGALSVKSGQSRARTASNPIQTSLTDALHSTTGRGGPETRTTGVGAAAALWASVRERARLAPLRLLALLFIVTFTFSSRRRRKLFKDRDASDAACKPCICSCLFFLSCMHLMMAAI